MTENPSTNFFMILSRVFLLPKTNFGMRTLFCDNFVSFAPILKIINVLETVGFALCIFSTFEFVADTLQFVADTLHLVAGGTETAIRNCEYHSYLFILLLPR